MFYRCHCSFFISWMMLNFVRLSFCICWRDHTWFLICFVNVVEDIDFFFFLTFLFEIAVDPYVFIRKNTERFHISCLVFRIGNILQNNSIVSIPGYWHHMVKMQNVSLTTGIPHVAHLQPSLFSLCLCPFSHSWEPLFSSHFYSCHFKNVTQMES